MVVCQFLPGHEHKPARPEEQRHLMGCGAGAKPRSDYLHRAGGRNHYYHRADLPVAAAHLGALLRASSTTRPWLQAMHALAGITQALEHA